MPRKPRAQRYKRKNPPFGYNKELGRMLSESAGNLLVCDALRGASLEEKIILSAVFPFLLDLIRKVPEPKLHSAIQGILGDAGLEINFGTTVGRLVTRKKRAVEEKPLPSSLIGENHVLDVQTT